MPQLRALLQATLSGAAEVDAYEMDLKRAGRATRRLVIAAHRLAYGDAAADPPAAGGHRRHRRAPGRAPEGRPAAREGDPLPGASASRGQQPADHRQRADAERPPDHLRADPQPPLRRPQPGDVGRGAAAAAGRLQRRRGAAARLLHRALPEHRRLDDPGPREAAAEGRGGRHRGAGGRLGQPWADRHRAGDQRPEARLSGRSRRRHRRQLPGRGGRLDAVGARQRRRHSQGSRRPRSRASEPASSRPWPSSSTPRSTWSTPAPGLRVSIAHRAAQVGAYAPGAARAITPIRPAGGQALAR